MKYFMLALSFLPAVTLFAVQAEAHSPQAVRYKLRDSGYSRIRFTDRVLPIYQLNACRGGRRFHLHVNYYGEVVRRYSIGWCSNARRYRRDYTGGRYRRYPDAPRYRDGQPSFPHYN